MKGGKQAGTIPPQSAEFAGPPLSCPRDKRGKARPDRQTDRCEDAGSAKMMLLSPLKWEALNPGKSAASFFKRRIGSRDGTNEGG